MSALHECQINRRSVNSAPVELKEIASGPSPFVQSRGSFIESLKLLLWFHGPWLRSRRHVGRPRLATLRDSTHGNPVMEYMGTLLDA
jgi:hypothetical protein